MLKSMLRATAFLAVALIPPASAAAADDDAKIVETLPPEVADVVTGGSWSEGKQGGFYRAIVVMTGSEQSFGARVYLQWLALSETDPVPKVVATAPLKEVNDQKLGNASIEIEGEETKDNEITIIVSSYDFEEDKDISLYVKGTAPGKYTMAKAPAKSPAAPPAAAPTNVPKDD
ncbi:hypothetical protein [Methyloceanibacter sp.]|uniref:hypothetical protein n=1 Tax=Methyloceanibacter sp. TaxID=1965321 RepID=UPI003D6D6490